MGKTLFCRIIIIFCLFYRAHGFGQDKRAQYPPLLTNSYVSLNIGSVDYSFSQKQLEPGYTAETIRVPHAALRVVLGHHFNQYLSAEISYMRPFAFVEYGNVNGNTRDYEVGMNVAGLSLKSKLPVSGKFEINAEAGLAVVTRGGFIVINAPGVKDVVYTSVLLGGGAGYMINRNWSLGLHALWSPVNGNRNQPATIFIGTGFTYTMRKLPEARVQRNTGLIFPKQAIQFAYTTNNLGYGVNNFVSRDAHIFWGGAVQVKKGFSLNYHRNIFHGRKLFSLDWGAGISYWQTNKNRQEFYTLSLYPVFRFTFLRSKQADVYLNYSFAGPAFISKPGLDDYDTGKKFTFQDFMSLGVFAGNKKAINAELKIAHYSNGNIFPQNNGVMIPLTFVLGYCFD